MPAVRNGSEKMLCATGRSPIPVRKHLGSSSPALQNRLGNTVSVPPSSSAGRESRTAPSKSAVTSTTCSTAYTPRFSQVTCQTRLTLAWPRTEKNPVTNRVEPLTVLWDSGKSSHGDRVSSAFIHGMGSALSLVTVSVKETVSPSVAWASENRQR